MNLFLFKLLSHLILPGTNSVLFILVGLILLIKTKKQHLALILLIIGVSVLYLFSLSPVSDLFLRPLENNFYPVQDLQSANTIIMLTGGEEGNILRAKEVLRLYYERDDDSTKIIISGNDPLASKNQTKTSAAQVKQLLIESGVNPEQIILEEMGRTTFESAGYVEKLIRQEPFFLVTSGYHMPRSMMTFKSFQMNPIAAPTDFKINDAYGFFSFFPSPGNLVKVDFAFHEYFGIIYYRLKLLTMNQLKTQ